MVSFLICKSLSHSGFTFVYPVRVCAKFIELHAALQLSQHHLLQRLSLLRLTFLPPLSKVNSSLACGLFLGCLFCPVDPYVWFCASAMLF